MTGEVKHLANNERYRILIIDGETYIMDIERSFWRIIFPFFFWLFPNHVFKVEDQALVEQLQTEKMERTGVSGRASIIGTAYAGGVFLSPLMNYFNIPMSPLVNIALLIPALILVGLLYFTFSHNRKKKLGDVIELESLPMKKLWIRPGSVKQFFNVFLSYVFLLGICVFFFLGYVETRNIMGLIITSGLLLGFLMINRKAVQEGTATVKFKG
ncbi:hypothetical protein GCM10007063_29700 [Lentibacillus kapialis]|uniref:DUF443 family protein n=1 Tax=Lentibacillus kapialis TaxID=340214 RepID=A0A917Q191_9BACI|nr:DUF443 family protein [Lentibacillus kapialis]GGK05348.1 hypothetical protein GCM10007063_29700 [Lentibacillus kapialis]